MHRLVWVKIFYCIIPREACKVFSSIIGADSNPKALDITEMDIIIIIIVNSFIIDQSDYRQHCSHLSAF